MKRKRPAPRDAFREASVRPIGTRFLDVVTQMGQDTLSDFGLKGKWPRGGSGGRNGSNIPKW
ncbi:hypothetical protein FTUN_7524 [Frigoriglobus tundricola]|uniref:Uncharacterized protein n=1 Tax=Frigoriglobus tundricola TaxID=2774151 RepID=A0A6M5Z394_9BACT|nr:hypothetical protein FTUN_7524 [Frigoriglobus tundricola]